MLLVHGAPSWTGSQASTVRASYERWGDGNATTVYCARWRGEPPPAPARRAARGLESARQERSGLDGKPLIDVLALRQSNCVAHCGEGAASESGRGRYSEGSRVGRRGSRSGGCRASIDGGNDDVRTVSAAEGALRVLVQEELPRPWLVASPRPEGVRSMRVAGPPCNEFLHVHG